MGNNGRVCALSMGFVVAQTRGFQVEREEAVLRLKTPVASTRACDSVHVQRPWRSMPSARWFAAEKQRVLLTTVVAVRCPWTKEGRPACQTFVVQPAGTSAPRGLFSYRTTVRWPCCHPVAALSPARHGVSLLAQRAISCRGFPRQGKEVQARLKTRMWQVGPISSYNQSYNVRVRESKYLVG